MNKNKILYFLVLLIGLSMSSTVFAQIKIVTEDEAFIERRFNKLSLFAGRLSINAGDNIIIRPYSINQFKTIYSWMFYSDPNRNQPLVASKQGGIPATIEYFFILKKSNSFYAKIKIIDENGKTKSLIININEALRYEELQILNSILISQYDLYCEEINKKNAISESDLKDYIKLFEPIILENKNEFELERIMKRTALKCDSVKSKSMVNKEYFEFHKVEFDKYNFNSKAIDIVAKKHFIYLLEPSAGSVSIESKPLSANSAAINFTNLKKKIPDNKIDELKSALRMGLISIERFNSMVSDADTTISIPIEENFAEKLFAEMDRSIEGRSLYLIYDFKIKNTEYITSTDMYKPGYVLTQRSLQINATLKSISVYADPYHRLLLNATSFSDTNINYTEDIQVDTIAEENKIYDFQNVSNPPEFTGGYVAWQRYLGTNLNSNIAVNNKAPSGLYKVEFSFLIDKDGSITDIKILKDPGYKTADEVFRVIKNSPKWKPATKDGKPVKYHHNHSITFYVSEE